MVLDPLRMEMRRDHLNGVSAGPQRASEQEKELKISASAKAEDERPHRAIVSKFLLITAVQISRARRFLVEPRSGDTPVALGVSPGNSSQTRYERRRRTDAIDLPRLPTRKTGGANV